MMQKNDLMLIFEALLLSSPAVCGQSDLMLSQEKERHRAAIALARAALAKPDLADDLIPDAGKMVMREVLSPMPHWYCVDKSGRATLCADRDDALQNAKMGAWDWPNNAPYRAVQLCEYQSARTEQEPVAAIHIGWDYLDNGNLVATYAVPVPEQIAPKLYTDPPKRQPLTDEQAMDLLPTNHNMSRTDVLLWVLRATERAHGIRETNT